MKKMMEIVIQADGTTRVTVVNDTPGHSAQLQPFVEALSDGDKKLAQSHICDHGHGDHVHVGDGHKHS